MDVTYAATCGAAIIPSPDDALTIEPPPVRSIALISSCTHIHAPRTLMSMTDSNCSSLCSTNGCSPPGMPALLNAQSRRPWRSVASATSATTSSRRVTSVARHAASPPASETSLAVSASASSATVAEYDLRALPGERQSRGAADPARRAGDHRDLALEQGRQRTLLMRGNLPVG